ncbi:MULTISPECIES: helix-turn-helix transcriptional regulator [Burkholderia]|uniref:helix-turn-helix transcriptional regulator n=1 Tax=Burkholderia TaxID=32008 RepID=UPI000BF7C072|nr:MULTISPECIES: helix-turn-helix transcriptional regulator [Burkholderia]PFH21031.1 regulatory LuxR family protein [Burkholderia sp. JKS000303]
MSVRPESSLPPHPEWLAAAPALVDALGESSFMTTLDDALARIVDFDLTCVLLYEHTHAPLLQHDNLKNVSESDAMHNYLTGTYLLDPVYSACSSGIAAGLYRMAKLAPDAFFDSDYYHSPIVHPCISMTSGSLAEEIVFIGAPTPARRVAYSLMRSHGRPRFTDDEIATLGAIQPLLNALLCRHTIATTPAPPAPPVEQPAQDVRGYLEAAFADFATDALTMREQEIVSLILRGHSSLSISHLLDIAEGTVKNHRKHIHAKLGISSQSELFHRFVQHLFARRIVS